MNKGICVSCNNAQEGAETSKADRTIAEVTTFYVGPIVAGIFVMILWYVLAWRPLCLVSCAWEERVFLCALAFTNFPIISTAKRLFANMCQAKGGGEISSAYLQTLFKILAGFLQVLGSFEITFEVDWPAIFDKMWAIASVFQVDLWSMPNAACFFVDASYFDKLRLQTVLPVVVVAAFGLPSAVAAVLGTCFHGGACNFPNWREITAKFDSSVMLFLFLVYPSISGVVLRALHCRDFGPDGSLLVDDHTGNIAFLYAAPLGRFLRTFEASCVCSCVLTFFRPLANISVDCDSDAYRHGTRTWALVCLFLYPVGIPVFMYLQMRHAGLPELRAHKELEAHFTFLLHLRRRQMSTMARAIIANALGKADGEEFHLRLNKVYANQLQDLFVVRGTGEPSLRPGQDGYVH